MSKSTDTIDKRILVTANDYVKFMQQVGVTKVEPRAWEAYYAPMAHYLSQRKAK
jgi:hypothetical protein